MNSLKRYAVIAVAFILTLGVVLPADAQAIVSSTASVNLSYVVGESITVTGAPPTLTFSGAPFPATGTMTIVTTWVLAATRTHIDTNLFFATPTAALTDGAGDNIPSSQVFANFNGSAFSACNSNPAPEVTGIATVGGTCNVGFGVAITSANRSGSNSSAFVLQLQGLSPSLPAGTYTGQLSIVAGAN